jgi:uncharacterized protein
VDADAVEIRVLGCLIEKQRTTPDVYPLTLNALRLACNQTTNREPVVEYDEATIRPALERLSRKGWVRLASGAGSRAAKYRHLLDEALAVSGSELSLLAILMLRGPQTSGELKQRAERLHRFASLDELDEVLAVLLDRELGALLPRRPGQKEQRYAQLLGRGEEPAGVREDGVDEPAPSASGDDRIVVLENRIGKVEEELAALVRRLGESTPPDALAVDLDEIASIGEDVVSTGPAADDVEGPVG